MLKLVCLIEEVQSLCKKRQQYSCFHKILFLSLALIDDHANAFFCKPLWWSCWRMFYSRWRVYRLIFLHQDRLCHTFILIKLLKLPLLFTSSPFQFDFHFSASFHPLFQRFLLFCTSQTRIQDKDKYSWWSFSAKIVKTL